MICLWIFHQPGASRGQTWCPSLPGSSDPPQCLSVFVEWINHSICGINHSWQNVWYFSRVLQNLIYKKKVCFNFGTIIATLLWLNSKNSGNALMLSCIWPTVLQISSKICRFYASPKIFLQPCSSQPIHSFLLSAVCFKKEKSFYSFVLVWLLQCSKALTNYVHLVFLL